MGSFFKPKTKTTQQPYEQNPWKPQQPFIQQGFNAAGGALTAGLAQQAGITDFTADMTPQQIQALGGMTQHGNNVQGAASGVMSAGATAAGGITGFNQNADSIYNQAQGQNASSLLNTAAQYADNPHLQGQIDAALGDVRKTFDRNVAGINGAAAGTGNINSTRAGTLEAYAADDAMDRAGQISSQMRGDQWNMGLQMGANREDARFSNMFNANAQKAQGAGMGMDFLNGGYSLGSQGYQDAIGAQGALQGQSQAEIDGKLAQSRSQMDLINRYMSTVGGSFGGHGFQSSTSTQPSIFQTLAGTAATVAGAM